MMTNLYELDIEKLNYIG